MINEALLEEHNAKELSETQIAVAEFNDDFELSEITDVRKRGIVARVLKNTDKYLTENFNAVSQVSKYDPMVMSLARRVTPALIAFDILGVSPLSTPTGKIFAVHSRYPDNSNPINYKQGKEALYDSVDTAHSGKGTHDDTDDPFLAATDVLSKTGTGMDTGEAEAQAPWKTMGIEISSKTVEAKDRQLATSFSQQIEQDMRAYFGIEVKDELGLILQNELNLEINQQVIRTLYHAAKVGVETGTAAPGVYNYTSDADGRWGGERALMLWAMIEREANRIQLTSRMGRGNFIVTSLNVATMLSLAGVLKNEHNLSVNTDVNIIGNSYVGTAGQFKIYVDPLLKHDGVLIGYKGASPMDAGAFFCPYIMLTAHEAISTHEQGYKKSFGFNSRYALESNPYTTFNKGDNVYYRKFSVAGL